MSSRRKYLLMQAVHNLLTIILVLHRLHTQDTRFEIPESTLTIKKMTSEKGTGPLEITFTFDFFSFLFLTSF